MAFARARPPPATGTQITWFDVSADPLGWLSVSRNATRPAPRAVALTMRPTTGSGDGLAWIGPATGELPRALPGDARDRVRGAIDEAVDGAGRRARRRESAR